MDKWVIHFLMMLHAATQDVVVKRRTKDGTQEEVNCPPRLPDYQAYMRGVDRGDQLMLHYNKIYKVVEENLCLLDRSCVFEC